MKGLLIGLLGVLLNLSNGDVIVRWDALNMMPKIGEPVQLTLTVTHAPDVQIIGWGEFGRYWGDFEVLSHDEVVISDGMQQQSLTVVLWQVDEFVTPDLIVHYRINGDDRIYQQSAEGLIFNVQSVLDQSADLRLMANTAPIKTFYIPLFVYIGGLVALLMLGILGYRLIRRKHLVSDDDLDLPLADVWRGKREDVSEAHLAPLKYAISQKLGYSVNSLTHQELLTQMEAQRVVAPQQLQRLKQLLTKYDYYRFSDEEADAHILAQFSEDAERWVATAINEEKQQS